MDKSFLPESVGGSKPRNKYKQKPLDAYIPQEDKPKKNNNSNNRNSNNSTKSSVSNISVGDKVQIKNGGIDVTNGVRAKGGRMYGEGGPLWATVEKIVEGWSTGGKWGLPKKVTKVRCSNNGVVVWQVRPEDIHTQVVKKEAPAPKPDPIPPKSTETIDALATYTDTGRDFGDIDIGSSNKPFATEKGSSKWNEGVGSKKGNVGLSFGETDISTAKISSSFFDGNAGLMTPYWVKVKTETGPNATLPTSIEEKDVYKAQFKTSWQEGGRRKELLNRDKSIIQNEYKYPKRVRSHTNGLADLYDYKFIPGDDTFGKTSPTIDLESKLQNVRASFGINVHGNNDIARSVKFYMYNRYKSPDTNLAFSKTFTHIFFTRPDLNLLVNGQTANSQTMNHTDTALMWRRNPEMFKLLTDYKRCGDNDNFNMLLSNQISSFSLQDETLTTSRAGKTWNEHEMHYAEQYSGRGAGELTCSFTETSELSVYNLIKLWMTYIDNVSRGAWSPLYDNNPYNHVFSRAIDYASSIYVFKCGPDGEDVLYWTKYYGVFPVSSGAGALGWDSGTPIGDSPKLNITFAYSYKKDMSPISLLEFNDVANVSEDVYWEPSFDKNIGHVSRPLVGSPYIEIDLASPSMGMMTSNDVNRSTKRTQIRLKFRKDNKISRSDSILFNNK